MQASAGNRATAAALAGRAHRPAAQAPAVLARRQLSPEELARARALTGGGGDAVGIAFQRAVGSRRKDIAHNASDAAFEAVIKPHVTAGFVKDMQEFAKGMVLSNRAVHARAGEVAASAIAADRARLGASGPTGDSAKARYAALQATAASRGSSRDKDLFFSDVQVAVKDAAADLGIAQATLKLPELVALLDRARARVAREVEVEALDAVAAERTTFTFAMGGPHTALQTQLPVYERLGPAEQDAYGDRLREILEQITAGTSATGLSPVLEGVVARANEFARQRADAMKRGLLDELRAGWKKGDIDRKALVDAAVRETAELLRDGEKVEELGAGAVRVVSEGHIHAALATAAPVIEKLVSKPDSSAALKIAVEAPVKGAVVGFDFSCSVTRSADGELGIAVDVGVSGGVGIAGIIKAAIGGGVYLDAKSKSGATALMDSVSLALFRRFTDAGVPYTEMLWGLGGRTAREGEEESAAARREAAAWAAMVEEEMGESGEVETGGFVKGTLQADVGAMSGGMSLTGKSGTLLDKRAFDKTKDRKAATGGLTVALSAAVGPLKGTLTGTLRTVTYPERDKDEVETSGSVRATLGGEVPGSAIYGDPIQMGMRIASWLTELGVRVKELVERIKEMKAKEEARSPELGDAMKLYGLASQIEEAEREIQGGVTGEWAEKHKAMVAASAEGGGGEAVKQLHTSTAGVTLGLGYSVDKDGKGKGAVFLDLTKTQSLNVGVAKISYASGERVWSRKWGGASGEEGAK